MICKLLKFEELQIVQTRFTHSFLYLALGIKCLPVLATMGAVIEMKSVPLWGQEMRWNRVSSSWCDKEE
jgi:hypothetical protein